MNPVQHKLINFIWTITNLLRGPYLPPQHCQAMLPMTVLRRLDCVLEPTKAALIAATVFGKIDVRSALLGVISP
ncbi:MAG: hypothetical protein IBX46_07875 [Desulfuromonadales bacterium]|nr:hypothetical protein [Desulfuromonadales bacterium]